MELDDHCSFCRKPSSTVETRLAAAGASICAGCVDLCREVLEIEARDAGALPPLPMDERLPGWLACAFCGRDHTSVNKLVAGPDVAICDGCVAGMAVA